MTTFEARVAADERSRTSIRDDLGRTMFVEAGAGTGKTTALVGRIVELVLASDPDARCPLSQIAAITFTEAAAAELRERVRITFEEKLLEARSEGRSEVVARCEQALADADVAAISTLHSFAQRLLSEFPVEVGVPPRVEVIDEVRSQLAFERRWGGFLDVLYEDPDLEEFIVRASILGVQLNGKQLRNIAQEFDDNWDRLLDVPVSDAPATPIDFDRIRDAIADVSGLDSECSDPTDKLLLKILGYRRTLFDRFARAETDFERLRVVRTLAAEKFGNSGRKSNWQDITSARDQLRHLAETCAATLDAVSAQTLQRFAAKIAEFTRHSAEERRAEGLLEFHDLLVLAHLLLRTAPEAREVLAQRYRIVMLDEFQDTDPIQISLALLLASTVTGSFDGHWSELEPEHGRLFMVGDPKQSIYRFRRADITVFLEARRNFSDGEVTLQQNFRTVEPLIDAINMLFGEIMAEETSAQAAYTPLLATRLTSSADHRPIVFGGPMTATARELREAEAADVAALVANIRDDPDQWLIGDGDGGWKVPALRDVTILLPTRTSMSQLSHALDEQSIPFRADTGTLVYETQEVKDLLSVLAAVDDPSDQIALVAALRSPLYACGYDDLYHFRSNGGVFDIRTPPDDATLGSVVAAGIEHIGDLARRRWWDEPSQLLTRLIDDRYAMALPAHGRRARDTWRRIRYVVDQARAFSESGGGDLRDYLAWTALQGADGSKAHEPMLPEPDDDAVQIMTIHGSKGLEFPITIVSGLTTRVGNRARAGEVVWGAPGEMPEVKASSNVRTAHFDLQKELDDEMDGPERDRLLYVALTRARDHLAVSGHHALTAKGVPVESHGARIAEFAATSGALLVRPFTGQAPLFPDAGSTAARRPDSSSPNVDDPTTWRARHRERLDRASHRSVLSATGLAQAADTTPHEPLDEDDDIWLDDLLIEGDDGGGASLPPQTSRRGRAGTSIGSAVHGVLQQVDLTSPFDTDLDALCAAQAWAESVPEHKGEIRASVESALRAPIVAACATARHWKELYVAAPLGDVTIEGYVDLLVEMPEGLIVVDYKTDAVRSEAAIDAKLERYSLQGAAYAVAVEISTGRSIADVQFVFARPEGPITRSIDDLGHRCSQVRSAALNA
jgi:ATP-dependent helicase/nuclease subunit A